MLKKIIIPIAAFAVTASSANALSPRTLRRFDIEISDREADAITEASELHGEGKYGEAEAVLEAAGVTPGLLDRVRSAQTKVNASISTAIALHDYPSFQELVNSGPLFEVIKTPQDFEQLATAHDLRAAGDIAAADAIFNQLGIEPAPSSVTDQTTELDRAIDNNDFQSFQALAEGTKLAELVPNEFAFLSLQQARALMRGGDVAAARGVMRALGFGSVLNTFA